MVDISQNIAAYISEAGPADRLASFDYCYNYFQSFREQGKIQELASPENIQVSCLQLGFYLASWGMLRGSTQISKKSLTIYAPLIQQIATFDRNIWDIDADNYSEANRGLLLSCLEEIDAALRIDEPEKPFQPSLTLITKIMLGVFGNVPAFDTLLVTASGLRRLNHNSLISIAKFYSDNQTEIDRQDIRTRDFATGEPTHRKYSKAKLIDMVWFIAGRDMRINASRGT